MGKLVVLRLDGDFEQGFRVILTIREEGLPPNVEVTGCLPKDSQLFTHLQHHWQEKYRCLGAPYRISNIKINYGGSVNDRIQDCKESAQKLRSHFNAWLDSEGFRLLDKRLREQLNPDETIRFLIRNEDKNLRKLPWQGWDFFERYSKAELAFGATQFEGIKPLATLPKASIKILAILGHSQGIDVTADRRLLDSLPHAETTFLVEKTRQEINDKLWEQAWDIIFFAGHSETEGETGRIYINPTESLTIEDLRYAIKKSVQRGLKIAIFNSCDGLGLAQQLNDLQIPQMIVMRELVPDEVAQRFLKYFLAAFSSGESFYLSVREARERLHGLEDKFPCASWLPVICQNLAEVPPNWNDLYKVAELPITTELSPPQPNSLPITIPELVPIQPNSRWQGLRRVLVSSVIVTSIIAGMRSRGIFQAAELKAFDYLVQLRPAEPIDERILLVKVTADDIKYLGGEYPLHDRTMLRLLKKLEEYKPRVIGLDIYRDRAEGEGREELVKYLQEKSDRVISICANSSEQNPAVLPPPGIHNPNVRLGFSDVIYDSDTIVRRHLLSMTPPKDEQSSLKSSAPCPALYALSVQLVFRYLEATGVSFKFHNEKLLQINNTRFEALRPNTGFYQNEDTRGYQILLNYRSKTLEKVAEWKTLTDVLNTEYVPESLKHKIVIIGVTDPTVKDNFKIPYKNDFDTPYSNEIRGLQLHAQMVSQILSAVENQRLLLWFLPQWGDILWIGIWSLIGGIITWRFQLLLRLGLLGVAALSLPGICFIFLLTNGVLLPLVPGLLVLLATSGVLAAYKQIRK
ncbi:CHASE2 domain-containing protein [Microcoleus sp. FACHB-SPT15]|uniref:CHASE2 domain-containing protein n=1 Tax=Microcoleus sp. FACHB-SPT15 TaxID=2692830 RepID=UPI0017874D64|nr:CHASE2 domain-containing protein [Microcoleus sp. FACHB-SPT15]MBD1806292.1 CHASE2 domain-containing protein [Microcoleus sp. FACHB-SPT15]